MLTGEFEKFNDDQNGLNDKVSIKKLSIRSSSGDAPTHILGGRVNFIR